MPQQFLAVDRRHRGGCAGRHSSLLASLHGRAIINLGHHRGSQQQDRERRLRKVLTEHAGESLVSVAGLVTIGCHQNVRVAEASRQLSTSANSSIPPMPRLPLDRRSFLLASGAAPAGLLLGTRDDPSDMAAFGRLTGLEFSEKELAQAEPQLGRLRRDYEKLRQGPMRFEMSPCCSFDPYPTAVA